MAAVFEVRHCTCASCHSTFRLPSTLRAAKGCHPPCDFQSTAFRLAGIRPSAFSARLCRVKPLSHDTGHVFAFAWGDPTRNRIQSTSMSVSCGCVAFWDNPMPLTECRSPAGYLAELRDRVRAPPGLTLETCARHL